MIRPYPGIVLVGSMGRIVLQRPGLISQHISNRKAVMVYYAAADVALVALGQFLKSPTIDPKRLLFDQLLPPQEPSGRRGDAPRVHPATQEKANRLCAPQPAPHRLEKDLQKVFDVLLLRGVLDTKVGVYVPVAPGALPSRVDHHSVGWRELGDALIEAPLRAHERPRKVGTDGGLEDSCRHAVGGQYLLHLRTKQHPPRLHPVVESSHRHSVPGRKEPPAPRVPNGEGEISYEVGRASFAPTAVSLQDELGIGRPLIRQMVPTPQGAHKFLAIVYPGVGHEHKIAPLANQGLVLARRLGGDVERQVGESHG